jgi:hypothetical protein
MAPFSSLLMLTFPFESAVDELVKRPCPPWVYQEPKPITMKSVNANKTLPTIKVWIEAISKCGWRT